MKKIPFLFLFFAAVGFSQTKGISYQALILDPIEQQVPGFNNDKAPLANKNICLQFSVIDENTDDEYVETHIITTDEFGMVNLTIGLGTITGGYATTFEGILWSTLPKNLKVAISMNGSCTDFTEISNAPFTAVPFALFAVNTINTTNANLTGMVTSVGNATTVVTNANLTGDVTSVGNATTIGADKVVSSMIFDATIVVGDLANDAVETNKIKDLNVTNAKLDKTNIALSGFGAAAADVNLGANKLTDVADPTLAQDAATKSYVDALDAEKLALAGGTMTGDITMGSNNISGAGSVTATTFIGDLSGSSGSTTGNAATATALETARTIGGVLFDGTANIDLPGVNTAGDQDTSGNAATATKIASIVNDDIVQLDLTQTLTNKTLTSPTITGTGAIAGTFTGNVTGNLTGDVTGNVSGSSANVSSISNNIQSSSTDSNAATSGTEYSATANIASGSRTFDSANSANIFNAGINLDSNSIVTITLTESVAKTVGASTFNVQPIVTAISVTNNTFTITTYAYGQIVVPSSGNFKFNFLVIK